MDIIPFIFTQIWKSDFYWFNSYLIRYDEIKAWASDKCSPLVREITFENAEELTEEGLPFLILFHRPDDNESVKEYTEAVQKYLLEDKRK